MRSLLFNSDFMFYRWFCSNTSWVMFCSTPSYTCLVMIWCIIPSHFSFNLRQFLDNLQRTSLYGYHVCSRCFIVRLIEPTRICLERNSFGYKVSRQVTYCIACNSTNLLEVAYYFVMLARLTIELPHVHVHVYKSNTIYARL